MKHFILSLFILIGAPVFPSDIEDALAQSQMECMLKGILVQHALSTIDASPSRAFDDFVSVLPEHMHPFIKDALSEHQPPEKALWRGFLSDVLQDHISGNVYEKMALIALEELFDHDLVFLIFQEGQTLYNLGKNKQALHVLTHIFSKEVNDFLEKIRAIKPYEEMKLCGFLTELESLVDEELARVLIREKLIEKYHEHVYLHASNRLREMDHMGAIELFMHMLPCAIKLAMEDLLKTPDLRIFTAREMCETFYQTHKKDLKHTQEQALVKAIESAEKFLILSLDPYYYMDI